MFPLPGRLQLEAIAVAAALALGMYLHSIWDGYKENQARKDVAEEHAKDVVADETAGLTFGTTLNDIAAVTTAGFQEIHRADLKPKPVTIYVEVPGQVVCPARSQWTPDLVRLFNHPGSPAPAGDADGGVRAVPGADRAAGGVPRDGPGEAERSDRRAPAAGEGPVGDLRGEAEAPRRPHQDDAVNAILASGEAHEHPR